MTVTRGVCEERFTACRGRPAVRLVTEASRNVSMGALTPVTSPITTGGCMDARFGQEPITELLAATRPARRHRRARPPLRPTHRRPEARLGPSPPAGDAGHPPDLSGMRMP